MEFGAWRFKYWLQFYFEKNATTSVVFLPHVYNKGKANKLYLMKKKKSFLKDKDMGSVYGIILG